MTTLADKAILSGVDNRLPMLEKELYDYCKSKMELYMMNRQNGRMILESVENGPLIWPTIEENGVTRPRKYTELTPAESLQAHCDVKATNIILQDFGLNVPMFNIGDDPIDSINDMMSFLTSIVTSRFPTTNNQLRNSSNLRQQATIIDGRVTLQPVQGRQTTFSTGTTRTYNPGTSGSNFEKQMTVICYNCKREGHMSKQCTKPKGNEMIRGLRMKCSQTVHMLTKSKFFYDQTTKKALGFQNPFHLKKAHQLEPKLYDGTVIKNNSAIVISDSEETLMLAEESRLKMLLKQKDPTILEKKVNTTRVDYAVLNQLSQDFEKRFVQQTKLSAKQVFWSQNYVNCNTPKLGRSGILGPGRVTS
nr:hypothetical protein [Tanacetum cinerariifolium]